MQRKSTPAGGRTRDLGFIRAALYQRSSRSFIQRPVEFHIMFNQNYYEISSTSFKMYTSTVILLIKIIKCLLCSYQQKSFRAVLRGHQNVVFRRQKRTTFDVKSSTYFTFYVGHSTRQGISLLRVSNRITHIYSHTHHNFIQYNNT